MRSRTLLALPLALALLVSAAPAAGAWSNAALLGPELGPLPATADGGGPGTDALNQALAGACATDSGLALARWFSLPPGDLGLLRAQGQGSIEWSGRVPPEIAVHEALVDVTAGSVVSCTGIGRVPAGHQGAVVVWFDQAEYVRARAQCANPMYGCSEPTVAVHVAPTSGAVPANDRVADAATIAELPFDVAGNRGLADDDGPLLVTDSPIDHQVATVWYRFVAPATGDLPATATGGRVGLGHATGTAVERVDGAGSWPVVAGETYLLSVSSVVYDYERHDPLPRGGSYHLYVGVPGAPAAPAITAASAASGALALAWTGDGSGAQLEVSLAGPGAVPSTTTSWGSGVQQRSITGLVPGAAYTVTARLRTAVGLGVPTVLDVHAGRSALDGETADRVDVAVDARSTDATALLTWSPAYGTPQAITGYRVARDGTDTAGAGPWSTTLPATATSAAFTRLVRGSTYRFSVTPLTADGPRPTATVVAPVLSAPVVPGSDLGLTYSGGTDFGGPDEYTMHWVPPSSDGQSPLTGYRVTRDGTDLAGDGPLSVDLPATATSFVLTGLRPNVNYRIGVRALNGVGAGAESALIAAQMHPDPPAAPTAVTALPGDGSASVSWTPPTTWGSLPAARYHIYAREAGAASSQLVASADSGATTAVVGGLTNGRSYTFAVQAWSTDSASALSAPSAAVLIGTPTAPAASVPLAPRIGTATGTVVSGIAYGTARWYAPLSDGGSAVVAYRVYAYRITATGAAALPVVSPRLTPKARAWTMRLPYVARYRFEVRAINAIGYSDPSARSNLMAPARVPTAPRIAAASSGVAGGAVTATARWLAPLSTGGTAITAYRVYAFRVSAVTGAILGVTVSPLVRSTARAYTMTLPSVGWYRFAVRAVNAMGYSPYSAKASRVLAR